MCISVHDGLIVSTGNGSRGPPVMVGLGTASERVIKGAVEILHSVYTGKNVYFCDSVFSNSSVSIVYYLGPIVGSSRELVGRFDSIHVTSRTLPGDGTWGRSRGQVIRPRLSHFPLTECSSPKRFVFGRV